jgi:hypothetical protein
MKREYPIFYNVASKLVVTPLVIIVTSVLDVKYLADVNAKDLYTICITGFGITVAMAQLTFRFIPDVRKEEINYHLLYAGEKFSLCSLLILQLILLVFCKDVLSPYIPVLDPMPSTF